MSCADVVQELQHTSATLAAMETSETTLKAANKQYTDQRGTIKQSHGLLRTMRVNAFKDSLKLYAALAFFAAVMAYVGLRRMSYFVPPAVINSLPSLKTFGLGRAGGDGSTDLPYLGEQQYDVPGAGGGGREGHSAAGPSAFQSSLAEVQRIAGILLRQAAHHGRRLAIWAVQQSQAVIASIKQKIEERQEEKLGQDATPEGASSQNLLPFTCPPLETEHQSAFTSPGLKLNLVIPCCSLQQQSQRVCLARHRARSVLTFHCHCRIQGGRQQGGVA